MANRVIAWRMSRATYLRYCEILNDLSVLDEENDMDQIDDLKSSLAGLPGFPNIGSDETDLFLPEVYDDISSVKAH